LKLYLKSPIRFFVLNRKFSIQRHCPIHNLILFYTFYRLWWLPRSIFGQCRWHTAGSVWPRATVHNWWDFIKLV